MIKCAFHKLTSFINGFIQMTHWREEFLISLKGFCILQFNVLYNGIMRGLVIFQAFISLIIYKMINNGAWGNVFSKPSINDVEGSGYTLDISYPYSFS